MSKTNNTENSKKFNEINKVSESLNGIKTINKNDKCEFSKIVETMKVVDLTDPAVVMASYMGTNLYEKTYKCPTLEQLVDFMKTYGSEYKNTVKEKHGTIKYKAYVKK